MGLHFYGALRLSGGLGRDGVNDAPSLAYADVSIAIGSIGSDAAMESADTVLDELLELAKWQLLQAGPELEGETAPTVGYREAQHLQCRALVASRKGNAGADDGTIGLEGYQTRRAHCSLNADIIKLLYPDKDWIA